MGITNFLFSLFAITAILISFEKEYKVKKIIYKHEPDVSFYNATMYEITERAITNAVQAKKALVFKDREELFDATIITRSINDKTALNTIAALNILKQGDKIYLTNNVNLQSSNNLNIRTEELNFNIKTNIVTNNSDFIANMNDNSLEGNSLYYDSNKNILKAKKTKFKIKVTDE